MGISRQNETNSGEGYPNSFSADDLSANHVDLGDGSPVTVDGLIGDVRRSGQPLQRLQRCAPFVLETLKGDSMNVENLARAIASRCSDSSIKYLVFWVANSLLRKLDLTLKSGTILFYAVLRNGDIVACMQLFVAVEEALAFLPPNILGQKEDQFSRKRKKLEKLESDVKDVLVRKMDDGDEDSAK